ncbi:hypothetical protein L1F28_32205 [Arthrospira platensis NCB002]|uniref:Uncharacterized protein n=1 Tax=Limnospira platensis NIES-46 TaxID=1236695 RepID=A0A5M3T033_LIMPL|nr:hypothetical protein [Arthrospira platensis]MDF2213252.1 hypothetical protein [Arthrospira platensis NCB002]BAI91606.1 hypothetical protein NIES39_J05600 [Arthrospira platensis NIES-39]BDT13899.1 hypothetical protein N39L_36220 [Arthrospira platensis NIES-39]GCE92764.1 hypothetical protein NIES46_08050 [Arthrospira platensis NIES-46]
MLQTSLIRKDRNFSLYLSGLLAGSLLFGIIGKSAIASNLNNLPDGDYSSNTFVLRKSGPVIIGVTTRNSLCFQGQLENGRIRQIIRGASVVLGDTSGNFYLSEAPVEINSHELSQADPSAEDLLNQCAEIFRPLVNLGINPGMSDRAIRQQLGNLNWELSSAQPRAATAALRRWVVEPNRRGVFCDQAGNFCIVTWRKGNAELSALLAVSLGADPPVVELCLIEPSAFNIPCELGNSLRM